MSLTLTGADAIIDAEKRSGKSVFIGYMRRYAEAFLRVKSILHAMSQQDIAYGKKTLFQQWVN
jgi:predicted dehydrogenase